MRRALSILILAAFCLQGATPPDILDFFGTAAGALAEDEPATFLNHFDTAMPNYVAYKDQMEALMAANQIESTIEVVNDDEAAPTRTIELDWLLSVSEKGATNASKSSHRKLVKCKIERRGKSWKIIAFEPTDFFKF